MKQITEYAPAKVNLYLKILGKRPDGYHEIETLFERIGIIDKITISELGSDTIRISCNDRSLPADETNICYKAAMQLKKDYKIQKGVRIDLIKNIPIAAGLGGGSSDAASIFKGLNKLWKIGLGREKLLALGNKVGSDVAFFLMDAEFAIGKGRGEILDPVQSDISLWHLVITPNIMLLTKDIYQLYSEAKLKTLTRFKGADRIIPPKLHINSVGEFSALLHNDLEDVVLQQEPIIRDIKYAILQNGAVNAAMSGSGPSVFGLFKSRKEALLAKKNVLRHFPDSGKWRAFVVRTNFSDKGE